MKRDNDWTIVAAGEMSVRGDYWLELELGDGEAYASAMVRVHDRSRSKSESFQPVVDVLSCAELAGTRLGAREWLEDEQHSVDIGFACFAGVGARGAA